MRIASFSLSLIVLACAPVLADNGPEKGPVQTGPKQSGTPQTGPKQSGTPQTGPKQSGTPQTGPSQPAEPPPARAPSAGAPSSAKQEPIIPMGREGMIKDMLSLAPEAPCKGKRFDVQKDYIVAEYDCSSKKGVTPAAVELHHPSAKVKPVATTGQFVFSAHAGAPLPPRGVMKQLETQVEGAAGNWTWKMADVPPPPDSEKPTPAPAKEK